MKVQGTTRKKGNINGPFGGGTNLFLEDTGLWVRRLVDYLN